MSLTPPAFASDKNEVACNLNVPSKDVYFLCIRVIAHVYIEDCTKLLYFVIFI